MCVDCYCVIYDYALSEKEIYYSPRQYETSEQDSIASLVYWLFCRIIGHTLVTAHWLCFP